MKIIIEAEPILDHSTEFGFTFPDEDGIYWFKVRDSGNWETTLFLRKEEFKECNTSE